MRDTLRFLTTLPLPSSGHAPRASSVRWFPVAGLVLGLAWAASHTAVTLMLDPFVAAAVVLIVDAVLTGGLHLDAIADVADGVASRRPADQAVRVMREPATGAVGAGALVLICLLRLSVLARFGGQALTLIAVPVAGRAAMALVLALVEARADGSLARAFQPAPVAVTAQAVGLAVVMAMAPALWPDNPAPVAGLVSLVCALGAATVYAFWWRSRFGPLTGDGAGAGGMLAETMALFVLAVQLDGV